MTDAAVASGSSRCWLRHWLRGPARGSDGLAALLVSLVARMAMVAWGAGRFPPIADGYFYHVVAGRIAQGRGYTWLWPDGAVTFAAHYPVGYPAAVGSLYATFGQHPSVAMTLNALLGALAALGVHRLAATVASRAGALVAALLVGLHPSLVGYTPALMTEGVVAALLALASWMAVLASRARPARCWAWAVGLGLLLGVTTLVRPQSLLLGPLLGALAAQGLWASAPGSAAGGRWRARALGAVAVTGLAVVTCLPWTLRNCAKMGQCVFVSAKAGGNLLIGAGPGATGAWVPIEQAGLPPECRDEFDEARKDRCFGQAALRQIRARPARWLALAPAKLAHTFDASGTPGWYLHTSNPQALPASTARRLSAVETVYQRLIVALALLALANWRGPRRRLRMGVAALCALWLLHHAAWVAYFGLAAGSGLLGHKLWRHPPALLAAGAVAATGLTHIVFFGAGRYCLVCYPLLAALAGCALWRAPKHAGCAGAAPEPLPT